MENTEDKLVQDLFNEVQTRKAEIAKAEKPNWETNCAFRYNEDSSASINLQVVGETSKLVQILAFLCNMKNAHTEAEEILGVTSKFKYLGYTFEAWVSDIKTRVAKIEITKKKEYLKELEDELISISPEFKKKLRLDEIAKKLGK